jgi:hypothetical protein
MTQIIQEIAAFSIALQKCALAYLSKYLVSPERTVFCLKTARAGFHAQYYPPFLGQLPGFGRV